MDIKSVPLHTPDGDLEITVTMCSYAINRRLAVNLLYKDDGFRVPYAFLTENLPKEPLQINEAFIKNFDENTGLLEFILENKLGTLCSKPGHSVFYTYPKVAFDMEKLQEFDPEGTERYLRKAQQKKQSPKREER